MSCCGSCCTQAVPPLAISDCNRRCFSVNTTYGRTYCEVYYPINKDLQNIYQNCSEVVLMIHGLGGSCKHWSESEIPAVLASRDCVVVTFDLYTHGKSEQLNNRTTKHTLDLFLQQVHDLVHHKDLPIRNAERFVLHGFSFGGFITLNYFAKYHLGPSCSTSCCDRGHQIHKVIFQSPWDGEIPCIVRGLIYIPGLLWMAKPNDMKYIRSNAALREILLNASKTSKFIDRLRSIVEYVKGNQSRNDQSDNETNGPHVEMLFLSGCIEFYFTKNTKKLHKHLAFLDNEKQESSRFKLRICNYADHMTFVHRTEGPVGAYYRKEVEDFLCPITLDSIGVENILKE